MKHFRLIIPIIIAVTVVLFVTDVVFMASLYSAIKDRYLDDVEQCLRRADLSELVERLTKAGLGNEEGVIPIWTGLKDGDIGAAGEEEELNAINYNQGYKRLDHQWIAAITRHLHDKYDDQGRPDLPLLEKVFMRELNFSGFYPAEVHIVEAADSMKGFSGLWTLEHRVDGKLIYKAYISPLTRNILHEMTGIIVVTVAIALVFVFSFVYMLRIIRQQRTIEEMKDDFTNNMTHELKTPIAIAYAANDALLQFPDPQNETRTRKYLTAALDQLSKLTGLVENILAMSMERRKNLTLSKEAIPLHDTLVSIADQMKMKAQKECRIEVVCREGVSVTADPSHFSNIVSNLIDNSIKYSGKSVDITVKADSESLSVSDNGIGIPHKALPEIFSKFYRVPSGNRQDVRGYGIGLFYVKSIVEKHGWSIEAQSKLNEGTTVTIHFNPNIE